MRNYPKQENLEQKDSIFLLEKKNILLFVKNADIIFLLTDCTKEMCYLG